jgi:hypothetical protein
VVPQGNADAPDAKENSGKPEEAESGPDSEKTGDQPAATDDAAAVPAENKSLSSTMQKDEDAKQEDGTII